MLSLLAVSASAFSPPHLAPTTPRLAVRMVPSPAALPLRTPAAPLMAAKIPEADFRLAGALVVLGPTLVLAPWIVQGIGGFFGLLGLVAVYISRLISTGALPPVSRAVYSRTVTFTALYSNDLYGFVQESYTPLAAAPRPLRRRGVRRARRSRGACPLSSETSPYRRTV